ncbi:glycosyltransferase [Bacillus sp. H-16]|uniref:glycosyltransferase n=1 Tax=Alteribacter salitolerans TaxID=2912333 RepID=UPI0019648E72|nr:glycosyltransferase [Alteribacter salitolerans]MBM7094873.1 glycosyltransferase [Alteribacter salitolerans]
MKKLLIFTLLITTIFTFFVSPLTDVNAETNNPQNDECMTESAVQLKGDLRKLWIDHTIWTRSYIVSALEGLEDQEKILERLLKNQDDLGDAIKPYYGEEAGQKLAELLREHIIIAGSLVGAVKNENAAEIDKYNKEWYKNADDISEFLSSANPNWSYNELQDLLYMHLKLVADIVTARVNKDWAADILAFDTGEDHIIVLADALTDGIIKQFPDQFN